MEEKKDILKLNVSNVKRTVEIGVNFITVPFSTCTIEFILDKGIKKNSDDLESEKIKETNDIAISPMELDYSNITIVLGKNADTSDVVNETKKNLKDLGIKVYISDSTLVTSEVTAQAANENPDDDIIAINVGGEDNKNSTI